jgi:enoyl-CoA hydratase
MEMERHDEVALLRLRGGKANAMTPDFLGALPRLVDEAEAGGAAALVVTGYDSYFSAGLALPLLVGLDRERMRGFMGLFAGAMLRVFRCELPVVAAVNGHAIAGGCVLALQCDARIMADGGGRIGLNEVRLGIGLPASVVEPLRLAVPPGSLRPIALEGNLFAPADALAVGLVDEVAPAGEVIARAIARAKALAQAPRAAYAQVKLALRRPALEAMERHGEQERERWLDAWFAEAAQRRLAETVARLTKS